MFKGGENMEDKIINIKGYEVIVSGEDYERVMQHKWHIKCNLKKGGAYFASYVGKSSIVKLHRFIINCPENMIVDHINGNVLDNRRSNLRICTKHQNTMNKIVTNTSGYKGVSWHKRDKKWQAQIKINYVNIHLGLFSTPELAHKAYCEAAIKYHGEFARFA